MREADDPPNPARHVPALDGVRGVAILLVLAVHTLPRPDGLLAPLGWMARAGWMGVDVFFVLSGFLITGILLETRGARGYYRSFFWRRFLRIWPLYLLVIAALAGVATWAPQLAPRDAADFHRFAPWIWGQAVNLRSALWGGVPVSPYSVGVYWSLGVEEQFYAVWAIVVALVARRRLAVVCLVLAVGSVALRHALAAVGVSAAALYMFPATHLAGLALGSALAAAVREPRTAAWVRRQVAGFAAHPWCVGVASVVVLAAWPHLPRGTWWRDLAGIPAASVVTALVIAAVVTAPLSPLARVLGTRWLAGVGRISYGVYLLHVPVLFFLPRLVPGLAGWTFAAVVLALTFAAAWASWRWWEGPWLSLKRFVPRPAPASSPRTRPAHARPAPTPASPRSPTPARHDVGA